jgi:hypothetical protein
MTSGHHTNLTHILENQALVAKLMDNQRECHADVDRNHLLKFEMAQNNGLQGAPDQALQMYQEMLQTINAKPNMSTNPIPECMLHGAMEESKYKKGKYGESMTHL